MSGRLKGTGVGKDNPNYKGDACISPINTRIRDSVEYKKWNFAVLKRDNFTCLITGLKKGVRLCTHHVFNFADYPKLRFVLKNGLTWNRGHHWAFHLIYGKGDNTEEQVREFLSFCY